MRQFTIILLSALCLTGIPYGQDTSFQSTQPSAELSFAEASGDKPSIHVFGMVGYGFGVGGSLIPATPDAVLANQKKYTQSQTINASGELIKAHDEYLNYGGGLKVEVGAELGVMEKVAAEISFEYTAGVPYLKVKHKDEQTPINSFEETFHKSTFGFKALAKPHFMVLDLLEAYCGVGIGLFFNKCTFNNSDTLFGLHEGYFKTHPSLGFVGQLGAYYPIHERLDIKAELAFEQMSFSLKELRPTESNFIYHYERNSTADNEYQPIKIPGSNLAIRVGVRFKLL